MKLKITRTQKSTMIKHTPVFCVDARVELNPDEAELVRRYKLGGLVVYNSKRSQEHIERGTGTLSEHTIGGFVRSMYHLAATALSLNITIDSLQKGHHIEGDMDQVLGAEEALNEACEHIKNYLLAASTFDGREQVIEFQVRQIPAAV